MILGQVLIVEDETFSRTMLSTSVQALGFQVVAACDSADAALAAARSHHIEVALLDLDLGPGPSGIDIAYALRAVNPEVGLVFLTSFSDPRMKDPRERPLPVGARFLVKSQLTHPEDLRTTLLDARHHPLLGTATHAETSALTELQVEVLRRVAAGASNAQIAREQGVTEKAIERTVQRISEALGVPSDEGNRRVLLTRAYGELSGKALPPP